MASDGAGRHTVAQQGEKWQDRLRRKLLRSIFDALRPLFAELGGLDPHDAGAEASLGESQSHPTNICGVLVTGVVNDEHVTVG